MTNLAQLADGNYKWDVPSGGTDGYYFIVAHVQHGIVIDWHTVSADGTYTTKNAITADLPARIVANYGHALREEINWRESVGRQLGRKEMEFKAGKVAA